MDVVTKEVKISRHVLVWLIWLPCLQNLEEGCLEIDRHRMGQPSQVRGWGKMTPEELASEVW